MDSEQSGPSQATHLAALRAARAQHKAIARGLQIYFDAVTAEQIPEGLLQVLNRADEQSQAV